MSNEVYDGVVIGSGFGGSVTACRLAEKGMRVLVLERGRRWEPADYPRKPGDAWLWDQDKPEKKNGWIDLRLFKDMGVAQGAGVGGGSLIYASIVIDAKPDVFNQGWPPEIRYETLKPYYEKVGVMMNVQTLPEGQITERYKLMQEGAEKLGYGARFRPVPIATTFNPEWHYGLEDPFHEKHSKSWTNPQGQKQGTCIHCGNCDIGCTVRAKNTLDLNYLPMAEQHGARIHPLHIVQCITPEANGYRVHYDWLTKGKRVPNTVFGRRVIIAAGSLGSTELLLRCRDEHKTLPNLSSFLGTHWSSNGDFLTPAFYDQRQVSPTQGPTITCAIDFLDGAVDGQQFFVEDGGFPDILGNYLERLMGSGGVKDRKWSLFLGELGKKVRQRDPLSGVMPWFGQTIDAANGRLRLARSWPFFWRKKLKLDWDIARSEGSVQALIDMHKRLSEVTEGQAWVPPTWTVFKNLITPHPLGGCNMGTSPDNGVVNHKGEVFGYPNLYVVDGAIVPEAVGLNPSKTIGALAERIAHIME